MAIGAALGPFLYICAELIPRRRPASVLGSVKRGLLTNFVSTWLQIRDGWALWPDGGRESEWMRWRKEWEERQTLEIRRSQ